MSDALAINVNNQTLFPMTNTKEKKKKVMTELKSKLEQAKLNLIYTELDNLNIPHNKSFKTVKDLKKSLKQYLNKLDYNKATSAIDNIEKKLEGMVDELEKGSTNAFTKLMTSPLSKTIAKTLGISLAGRTALLLAPTIGTKALVAAGLGSYALYRLIKNRKDIIKANQENELNNMLMELETTKDGNEYIDTRFSEQIQEEIKNFLKTNNIEYVDTGYRSLREAIYSLDFNKKRSLIEILNSKIGKELNIEERMKKAKRKLNVVATTSSTVGTGFAVGASVASTVNSVDPAILSGALDGTLLGAWIKSKTGKNWFTAIDTGLGIIGGMGVEHIPIIGGVMEKFFAAQNLATLSVIGATGGLITGGALTAASIAKNIHSHIKANKETKKFLKLDSSKYAEEDKKEMEIIREKLHEPKNQIEVIMLDIIIGYLKENNIQLSKTPNSIEELSECIKELDKDKRKIANDITLRISNELHNNPQFVSELKKAGKISIGLFTAGLALMSVYDIIKGGTFLPELSQKLFPEDNINKIVNVPAGKDTPYNINNKRDAKIMKKEQEVYDQFKGEEYLTEKSGIAKMDEGMEYFENNKDLMGIVTSQEMINTGKNMYLGEQVEGLINYLFGGNKEVAVDMVPNIPAISSKISQFEPDKLLEFYRYFNTIEDDGSQLYRAIQSVLGYSTNLEKVSTYINGFEKASNIQNLVSTLSSKIANGMIPLSLALETLGIVEKTTTTDKFKVEESHSMGK